MTMNGSFDMSQSIFINFRSSSFPINLPSSFKSSILTVLDGEQEDEIN